MTQQELAKMGSASVNIQLLDGKPCIRKSGASAVERHFYQCAAPHLSGLNTPALLRVEGETLFLEQIPHPVTLTQLHHNEQTFAQLASLHNSRYQPDFTLKTHGWSQTDTDEALSVLCLPEAANEKISHIQQVGHELFEEQCLISGDSNEGNWGTRDNGELVLFDWERFGYGSPAIDLAPLVPRMGSLVEYEAIIERYLRHSSPLSGNRLLRQLIMAKCWLIIEVTNLLTRREKPQAQQYLEWYRQQVPHWLESVAHIV
ncbi:phosphotransferase family protein [Aeromonas dhakensis]|uniref:phosphotransferase family protein n=1 Tax=Aeromonas dhakensis TaxID=196024 RepID=UPI001CEFF9A7|nr:phosphotransferase [Aeromonas dhakensis]UCM46516.1 aminoglycoside phosphotransferase family protein [Aeromonas dhakensis]